MAKHKMCYDPIVDIYKTFFDNGNDLGPISSPTGKVFNECDKVEIGWFFSIDTDIAKRAKYFWKNLSWRKQTGRKPSRRKSTWRMSLWRFLDGFILTKSYWTQTKWMNVNVTKVFIKVSGQIYLNENKLGANLMDECQFDESLYKDV